MGKVAKVRRLVVMRAVAGSVCSTLPSAASTSCSVRNMSTFQSKKRLTSAEPRLVVERTVTRPGTAVDRVFDGLGDGDLHLLDRHDAVVDADDDAGEIGLREDGDRNTPGGVDPDQGEDDEEEEDGSAKAQEPKPGVIVELGTGFVASSINSTPLRNCRPSPLRRPSPWFHRRDRRRRW